jgi:2-succinyl-6-hydroxy-2,4-cyclohexadiene-1-carboxylate synthase
MNHHCKQEHPLAAILKWHPFGTESTSAPAAIMLHGFMGCGEDWKAVAKSITPSLRCYCPDLPGHGSQRYDIAKARACIPEIADALIEYLDAGGIDTCTLIGYSMGGRIALHTALHYPHRITRLILVSTSPGLRTEQERTNRLEQDKQLQQELADMGEGSAEFEAFLRRWYQQTLFSELSKQPALFESIVQKRIKNNPPALSASLNALGVATQPDCWNDLSKLPMPTLVVVGEKDEKYWRIGNEISESLPKGRLEIIKGCSHSPHVESPEQFTAVLNLFLRYFSPTI